MNWRIAVASIALLAWASAAHATGVTVVSDPGTTYVTTALTGYSTTGAMMDGMAVTGYFSDGSSQTALWGDTGASSGAAFGTGWSLSETGDTWTGTWTLANASGKTLTRLLLDGATDDTLFDRTNPSMGTPGSASGLDFTVTAGLGSLDIRATYRDIVALTGFPPVGDIYLRLDVAITPGLPSGSSLAFKADTDNLSIPHDITPIPEPLTMLSVLAGTAGLGTYLRKRAVR